MTGANPEAGKFHGEFSEWKKANDRLIALESEIQETRDALDDPTLPPAERTALLEKLSELEQEQREKEADKQWEAEGGFPCDELDCSRPEYKKCRPPCKDGEKCRCSPGSGPPSPPEDPPAPGKHRPDAKKSFTPDYSGGEQDEEIPAAEDPSGGISSNVMEIYRKALRRGIDPARVLNQSELDEVERLIAEERRREQERARQSRKKWGHRLNPPPLMPPGTAATPPKRKRKSTGFWFTDALDRLYSPLEPISPAVTRGYEKYNQAVAKGNRMAGYVAEGAIEGLDATSDLIAQGLGIAVAAQFEAFIAMQELIAGRTAADNSKAMFRVLLRRFAEMLEESEENPLTNSGWEKWAVGKVRVAFDAGKDPEKAAKDFAVGFKEAVLQFPALANAAKSGDEKAQAALIVAVFDIIRGRVKKFKAKKAAVRAEDLDRKRRGRPKPRFPDVKAKTDPSRLGSPNARAIGEPRMPRGGANSPDWKTYLSEKESADILAQRGYVVRHTPQPRGAQVRKPDFEIEGRKFEHKRFAERPASTRGKDYVYNHVDNHLTGSQGTNRYVVDLRGSSVTPSQYAKAILSHPTDRIREVLVIANDNEIVRVYP